MKVDNSLHFIGVVGVLNVRGLRVLVDSVVDLEVGEGGLFESRYHCNRRKLIFSCAYVAYYYVNEANTSGQNKINEHTQTEQIRIELANIFVSVRANDVK